MSKPNFSPTNPPLALNPRDIKRICVVHWESEPLAEGQKSSYVTVKPLNERKCLPNDQGMLRIEGQWYKQLSKDSTETFRLGDQINVIFHWKSGGIRWLERRDGCQAMLNQLFT